MWRCSDKAQLQAPDIKMHGWDENNNIKWLEEEFPEDIQDLLFDQNDPNFDEFDESDIIDSTDETDIIGRDEETDDEEEINEGFI